MTMQKSMIQKQQSLTKKARLSKNGAGTRIRTVDLLITSQLLYQLSYAGNVARILQKNDKNASQKIST